MNVLITSGGTREPIDGVRVIANSSTGATGAAIADAFFAAPHESVRGWERAADAQSRIVRVCNEVLAASGPDDILMVGHGGVGTLLYCHLAKLPIARIHDQPTGGGNVLCFDLDRREMIHGWQAMESFAK